MDHITVPSGKLVAEYAGAPTGQPYDVWREEVCRSFCRIDAEPSIGSEILCRIEIAQISSIGLATTGGTSGRFVRNRDLLLDNCDDFILFGATAGKVLVTRENHSIELQQSQMWLTDLTAESAIAFNNDNQFQTIRVPRRELLSICPGAEASLAKPLVGNPGIRQIIANYFALSADAATTLDAVGQQLIARHMVDLIALLLSTGKDETELAAQRGYSEARLQLIQARVLECLPDDSLSIASVAKHFGLSPKQVQRLFERIGTTFTEFVLEQRLLLAHRLLSSSGNRHDKIGTIAYAAGFGDLSYFNRTFRARFGMTPSEWRFR